MFRTEEKIQKFLGIRKTIENDEETWKFNKLLHLYFIIFTNLGNLYGYIISIIGCTSYLYYRNVDNPLAIYGYCHAWVWSHTITELLKSILRLPRPDKSKNSNLYQSEYEHILQEYGPPSSHVVGITIALYPFISQFGLPGILFTIISVSLSRIYFGAHSIFCVVSGSFIALIFSLYFTEITNFLTTIPPIFNYGALLVILKIHPSRSPNQKFSQDSAKKASYVATVSFMASIFQMTNLAFYFIFRPIIQQLALLVFFVAMIINYRADSFNVCIILNCIIHISIRGLTLYFA